MSWDQEAREVVARAIAEEIDHLPFGELDEPHRAQARESYLRDADAILAALAPAVAREVARGKAEALREAAKVWRWGAWAEDLPPAGADRAALILGMTQRASDWLRVRAATIDTEAGGS